MILTFSNKPLLAFFTLFHLASAMVSSAQIEPMKIQVLPPSPNAASLGKYGDVPVSYYTGTPNITIPIYQLQGRELSVPISLSYHAGGNKVEDIASWVGLGWSLNAGGAIVRMVRGIPDEGSGGILSSSVSVNDFFAASASVQNTYMTNSNAGLIDFEPDVFIFNFNGRSGKFFLEKVGNELVGYPTPYSDLQIRYTSGEWTITDEMGVKYSFGGGNTDEIVSASYGNGRSSLGVRAYTSAWYLKKITSPKGEEINFQYTPYFSSYCQRVSETKYYLRSDGSSIPPCTNTPDSKGFSEVELTGSKLSKITSTLGIIDFVPAADERLDINGDKALDRIIVRDFDNRVLKQFAMSYTYFESVGGLSSTFCNENNQNSRSFRLRLDRITEQPSGGNTVPPYIIEYNQERLPDRLSNSMDHWGYYNGQNNATLVPSYLYSTIDGVDLLLTGANRSADPTKVTAGIIKKIIYPTGGSTEFEFEAHEAFVPNDFLYREEFVDPPLIPYASVQSWTGRLVHSDFVVSLPKTDPLKPPGGYFEITVSGTCNASNRDGDGCGAQIFVNNIDTQIGYFVAGGEINGHQTNRVFLPNGNYSLISEAHNFGSTNIQNLRASVAGPDPATAIDRSGAYNKKIGGTRIKRIISNAREYGSPPVVKRFTYYSENVPSQSSGVIVSKPIYSYTSARDVSVEVGPGAIFGTCLDMIRTATSQASLATTQGSHVGYEFVQIYHGDNGDNGREIVKYTTSKQHPDVLYETFPFAPSVNLDWRRGLVMQNKIQSNNVGIFIDKQVTNNNYQFFKETGELYLKYFDGIKMGCAHTGLALGASYCIAPVYVRYSNRAEWFYLSNTSVREINTTNQNFRLTTQESFYERAGVHVQPTKKRTVSSNNKTTDYITKYPLDYASTASPAIDFFKTNHLLGIPLEQQEWKDGKLVKGQVTEYTLTNAKPVLKGNYLLENTIPLTDFVQNQSGSLYLNAVPDSRYKSSMQVTKTDPLTGNVLEVKSADGIVTSYTWSYQNSLLVAETKNAAIENIFYTGFENANGTIGEAKAGDKYYNGTSYTVPLSERPIGSNLKMTFWYFDNGWKFQSEMTYNPVISISGAVRYDEIRIYPSGSLMTTYTYKPGVGISSIMDHNNRVSYFKYDTFNRLQFVTDNESNILKKYSYNYFNGN